MADLVLIVVLWSQAQTVGKGRPFMLSLNGLGQSVDNFVCGNNTKKPTGSKQDTP
ncbi:MAG: hypothetical protein RBR28_04380 [Lentimicrobium sp.]|jgi:hypothetical protein|nr:hypothetical protein [Lentimicrobium sp.]